MKPPSVMFTDNSRHFPAGGGGAPPGDDPRDGDLLLEAVVEAVPLDEDEAPLAAVLEGGAHAVGGAHPRLGPDHRRTVQALSAEILQERKEEDKESVVMQRLSYPTRSQGIEYSHHSKTVPKNH